MNKKQKKLYAWLLEHPGYLKKGIDWLVANNPIKGLHNDCRIALKQARIDSKKTSIKSNVVMRNRSKESFKMKLIDFSEGGVYKKTPDNSQYDPGNVIFLPDLHAPFIKDGVLEFCKQQQRKYDCGTVIFAGDIVDGHAWSYHEHDPDGMSVGHELEAARKQLLPWFEAFPTAKICMGNHDLLIERKARTIGLSKHFIKGFGDVIGAPKTWEFGLEFKKDNVLYKHGNVGDAFKVAQESRMSTCQGHFHAKTFVQWSVSEKDSIFGLQVGWAADRHAYAFDYGKPFAKKPIISCGIILDKGKTPIVKLMSL